MEKPLGPMKRLVKTELRIIEPTQMEASFQYRLMVKGEGEHVIYPDNYQIDSYFFFPHQMKISQATYPLESFYRDMKSYLNFRIPKLAYKEIMGYVENADRSPLLKIRGELGRAVNHYSSGRRNFIEQEAKIFACSFHTFIQRKQRKIVAAIAKGASEEGQAQATLEQSLTKISVIFQEWNKVLLECEKVMPELRSELHKIDEYLVHNIHDFLLRVQKRLDGTAVPSLLEARSQIRIRLRALRIYSRQVKYAWVDDSSSELQLESYLYHRGYLKRQVWSALYLDTRTKPLFYLQRQVGAMVAAGIAGAWAALANLFLVFPGATSAQSLSFSTFILVTILSVAYVLKDRIKELGRGYFKGGLFRNLPDSRSKVVYESSGEKSGQLEVGTHEEKVAYMDTEKLPQDLLAIMEKEAPGSLDKEDLTIICYRKRLKLRGEEIRPLKRKIRAIYTFFRLNISSFLAPLDNPLEEIPLATHRFQATARQVAKVYHIDLVLRITTHAADQTKTSLEYFRMIVSKTGLKRIDRIRGTADSEQAFVIDEE